MVINHDFKEKLKNKNKKPFYLYLEKEEQVKSKLVDERKWSKVTENKWNRD